MQKINLPHVKLILKHLFTSSCAVIAASMMTAAASAQSSQGLRRAEITPTSQNGEISRECRRREGKILDDLGVRLANSGIFISEEDCSVLRDIATIHGGYDALALWDEQDFQALEKMSTQEREAYLSVLSSENLIGVMVEQAVRDENGSLHKFAYRLKSPHSVYETLHCRPNAPESISSIKDLVRYTALFDEKTYIKNTLGTLNALNAQGFTLHALWNAWSEPNYPYNGINATLLSPKGQLFELQFHTAQGATINDLTHKMYEKRRLLEKGSPEYQEILNAQFALAKKTRIPQGTDTLLTFNHESKSVLPKKAG